MSTTTLKFDKVYENVIDSFKEMDNNSERQFENIQNTLNERHEVPRGFVSSLLTREPEEVFENEDVRLPMLFVKEALEQSRQTDELNKVFTKSELKELEQFLYAQEQDSIKLPLEFFPALKLNEVTHSVRMSASTVAKLFESQIVNYSFDIQREAVTVKREDTIIKTPKINRRNVTEIRNLLLKGQLKDSTIYLNAAPRTADSGDELLMDEKNHKLIVTEGTRLDVLDGYHRCLASLEAYARNPELDFNFNVVISNYTTKEAQQWQAQHAKAMPWSPHRVKELQQEGRSDKVVAALRSAREIGEVIGTSSRLAQGQITNFTSLSAAIKNTFKINNRREEVDVVEYLTEYLDEFSQYDIDWSVYRGDNPLTSSIGVYGIIYYLSKNQHEMSTNKFYNFLDKYRFAGDELKEITRVNNLNRSKISKAHMKKIEKLVDEVSQDV